MDERLLLILSLVEKKTELRDLDWEEAAGEYHTEIGQFRVVLRRAFDPLIGGSLVPRLVLYDSEGHALESLVPSSDVSVSNRLQRLMEQARKQALQVDESIEAIIKKLSSDKA